MMVHAGLHENLKTYLCPKYAATATKPKNIIVNPHEEKYAYENFYSKIPEYIEYLSDFE